MNKTLNYNGVDFTFKAAYATNTRLMGVVGLEIIWENASDDHYLQIYHLDFEAYGIDGFHSFLNGLENDILMTRQGVIGGLGGTYIELTWEEAMALILSTIAVDAFSVELLVDFEAMLPYLNRVQNGIDASTFDRVIKKLSPQDMTPISLINYVIMRLVGCDYDAAELLFEDRTQCPRLFDRPSTLLKNVTQWKPYAIKPIYEASTLIDFEDKYMIVLFKVILSPSTNSVVSIEIKESLKVSSIEASFNLNKSEHMLILQAKDAFFERRFERQNPEFMKQYFPEGKLYMEYNPHNLHVEDNPYYLNGDLYASYFFCHTGQVIVSSFEGDHIKEIDQLFKENGIYEESLSFVCELKTDHAVLYSFAQSGFDNIFDYLDQRT